MPTDFIYPPNPVGVPDAITHPSPAFKKEVSGVMGSIVFFFIVYALLLLLSAALVAGCVYAGIAIIVNLPRLITIIAGIGLIGVGVMVFIFLVKFLFSVSRYDRSGIVEITEQDQPALFGFIRQLAADTQTQFPRKIYISADVNACVFYDSSFWSMFFPVKKNLQIGLGLVNAVNVSEFKAVMAHEFGHFSQRSMKLGSFVYQVNRIIFNMLYDNKGYAGFLQSWANIDGLFAIFASITAGIANGIQKILRGMYAFINKRYMGLSRQMEFHADAVAASVSGSRSLGTALRRVELASSCYDITLEKCDLFFKQNKISANIYRQHELVTTHVAEQYQFPLRNGLPVISDDFFRNSNSSRINFKDQWASHPSTEDRVKHLEELAVPAEVSEESAWVLFTDKEGLQKQLTEKIYGQLQLPEAAEVITDTEFDNRLKEDLKQYRFAASYLGFYDNRQIAPMTEKDWEADTTNRRFDEMVNPDTVELHKKAHTILNDIELLKAITDKRIDTKSFDFDGVKYAKSEAPAIIARLEAELSELKTRLEKLDRDVVHYFIQSADRAGKGDELKGSYLKWFNDRARADLYLNKMNAMLESMGPVFSGETLPVETIQTMIRVLKQDHEPGFKQDLRYWLSAGAFAGNTALATKAQQFADSDYQYFGTTQFFDHELNDLHSLCNESWAAVNDYLFRQFKSITEQQLAYTG